MKKKHNKFVRILNGVKITVIVEKTKETPADILDELPTKKTEKMSIDWVLSEIFDLEYTYSQAAREKSIQRRRLFCKKQFDKENFTDEEGYLLAKLSSDDYWYGNKDTLYCELVNELDKFKELEALKNKPILTEKEKQERLRIAKEVLEKLRKARGL